MYVQKLLSRIGSCGQWYENGLDLLVPDDEVRETGEEEDAGNGKGNCHGLGDAVRVHGLEEVYAGRVHVRGVAHHLLVQLFMTVLR